MELFLSSINIQTLKRDLTLRFTLLLSVFLVLLIVSYFFAAQTIDNKEFDSILLNIAGRQRLLVREYVSEVNQVLVGLTTSNFKMAISEKKKVDLTSKLFEKIHKAFISGGEIETDIEMSRRDKVLFDLEEGVITIIPPQKNQEILTHLNHVYEEWIELKRISLLSLRSNKHSISNSPYVHRLLEQASKTVVEMDHVVHLMQYNSEIKLRQLDTLLMMVVIASIVLFLIIIYFVYSKIVLPLDASISVLQQTTENLKKEKIKAEKASMAKSDFLSHMSHELRTPMNAILGFGQLLELDTKGLTVNQQSNIKEIMDAGYYLLNLINEVLDLAKVESGKMEVCIDKVQVDSLLHQCLVLITGKAKTRHIEINDHVSNKGYVVQGDFIRLKQVLLNILSNAVKYNNEGGRISLDSTIVDRNRLRISFTDTGQGLTKEEISKLFVSFERLNSKDNVEGTGIGLVITKHLIELMGGSIGVDATPGVGSTFWIELIQSKNT